MIDSGDMKTNDVAESGADMDRSRSDILPSENKQNVSEGKDNTDEVSSSSFSAELVKLSIKAVAIALSLVVLILSILTVAMPLPAMRTYNKLGMSERALNCGDRYITLRLKKADANYTDDYGNYTAAAANIGMTDSGLNEALDVCISLSDGLMKDSKSDAASRKYFAEKLDKYIRLFLSTYGVRDTQVTIERNAYNIAAVDRKLRPFVYDYGHMLLTMDYRARTYTDELDSMPYNTGTIGTCMTTLAEREMHFNRIWENLDRPDVSRANKMLLLDEFCDYFDQIGEYLSVQEEALGITGVISEVEAGTKFLGKLTGNEFSLFVSPRKGPTDLYNFLVKDEQFKKYAQWAVDFSPSGSDMSTLLDEQLHQLYWVRILTSTTQKLLNMGRVLYADHSKFGVYTDDILDMCAVLDRSTLVRYESEDRFLSGVYGDLMQAYLDNLG